MIFVLDLEGKDAEGVFLSAPSPTFDTDGNAEIPIVQKKVKKCIFTDELSEGNAFMLPMASVDGKKFSVIFGLYVDGALIDVREIMDALKGECEGGSEA